MEELLPSRYYRTVTAWITTGSTGTVRMRTPRVGRHRGGLVDDVHSLDHPTDDRVAVRLRVGPPVVEPSTAVVHRVDEELRGGAVDDVGSGHRDRATLVAEAVGRFVLDGRARALLREISGHPATLDHESLNNPVKHRAE